MIEAEIERLERESENTENIDELTYSIISLYNSRDRQSRKSQVKRLTERVSGLDEIEKARLYVRLVEHPGAQNRDAYKICGMPKLYCVLKPEDIVSVHTVVAPFKAADFEMYLGGSALQEDYSDDIDLLCAAKPVLEINEGARREIFRGITEKFSNVWHSLFPRMENVESEGSGERTGILYFGSEVESRHKFDLDGKHFDLCYSPHPFTNRPRVDHVRL